MNPNNAGKDLWLQSKTGKEKLKQQAQTQDDILCKLHYVKDDKFKCCISTLMRFMGGGRETPSPVAPHVSSEALAMQHAALWNEKRLKSPAARILWSFFQ